MPCRRRPASPFVVSFQLGWTFFGLTSKYRLTVQEQLFDLIYYGKGFSYTEAYNMPVYLRHFFIRKINKIHKDRKKAEEKAHKKAKSSSRSKPPKFRRPKLR